MAQHLTLTAPAIHCGGCGNSIARSLGKLTGVEKVNVDIDRKQIDIDFDPDQVSTADIALRLELAGFPAQEIGA